MAVLPTKGNLIATKHSLALASAGYELMDRKRNILTREMMSLISQAEELQSRISVTFTEAYEALTLANITLGNAQLQHRATITFGFRYRDRGGIIDQ